MRWAVLDSPIGPLSVAIDEAGVCGVRFGPVDGATPVPVDGATPVPDAALDDDRFVLVVAELRAYFAGELTEFTVPLSVRGGSEFERAVWDQMTRIPYGEMRTYGEIATAVGDPGGARAVGTACNRNPIPVIVPCHRIVGAGGKLVGFGGGLPRKRQLLELEAGVAFQRSWGG